MKPEEAQKCGIEEVLSTVGKNRIRTGQDSSVLEEWERDIENSGWKMAEGSETKSYRDLKMINRISSSFKIGSQLDII